MFNFESIQRTAASIVGAVLLSAACIGTAVGPGFAQTAAPAAQQLSDRAGA